MSTIPTPATTAAQQQLAADKSEHPTGAASRIKNMEFVATRLAKKHPHGGTEQERADFLLYDESQNAADYRPIRYRPYDVKTLTNFEKWADANGELKKPAPKSPRPGSVKTTGPGNAPPVPSTIREGLLKTYGPKRR